MTDERHEPGYLPLNRSEALTDGIFAVAMTLLVIELKLPEHGLVHSAGDLHAALLALLPKAIAWVLSFFVLALFWIGHHRVFAHVRRADARLVVFNLLELAAVSLMPPGVYEGARMRILGVVAISVVAIVVAALVPVPGIGSTAFLLMSVISPWSRRLERRRCRRDHQFGDRRRLRPVSAGQLRLWPGQPAPAGQPVRRGHRAAAQRRLSRPGLWRPQRL